MLRGLLSMKNLAELLFDPLAYGGLFFFGLCTGADLLHTGGDHDDINP